MSVEGEEIEYVVWILYGFGRWREGVGKMSRFGSIEMVVIVEDIFVFLG